MRRIIRAPGNKRDLVARALTALELVLDIEDGIAAANALLAAAVLALRVEQLVAEGVVVRVRRRLLDDDFLPVVADLVNDPLQRLAELEVVEGADALGRDGDTARVVSVGASEGIGVSWARGAVGGEGEVRMGMGGKEGGEKAEALQQSRRCWRGTGQLAHQEWRSRPPSSRAAASRCIDGTYPD